MPTKATRLESLQVIDNAIDFMTSNLKVVKGKYRLGSSYVRIYGINRRFHKDLGLNKKSIFVEPPKFDLKRPIQCSNKHLRM